MKKEIKKGQIYDLEPIGDEIPPMVLIIDIDDQKEKAEVLAIFSDFDLANQDDFRIEPEIKELYGDDWVYGKSSFEVDYNMLSNLYYTLDSDITEKVIAQFHGDEYSFVRGGYTPYGMVKEIDDYHKDIIKKMEKFIHLLSY